MASEEPRRLTGLAQYLINQQLLDADTAQELLKTAEEKRTSFIHYLYEQDKVPAPSLSNTISQFFGIPQFDLSAYNTEYLPSELLQSELVKKKQGLPLFMRDDQIYIAVTDPTLNAINELRFLTGVNVYPMIVLEKQLKDMLNQVTQDSSTSTFDDLSDTKLEDIDISNWGDETTEENAELTTEEVDNSPVVKFINKIILDAINMEASDIHLEPYDKTYRIRFRLDGILQEITQPPHNLINYFVTRLKVMAGLDISERRIPQDGRFRLNLSKSRSVNFRVSTCPTLFGEKIVIRILQSNTTLLDIDMLGFTNEQKDIFTNAIKKPQGTILVTGPTGSGKTVTLYTALNILNTPLVNISTVEDPIEIQLQGINQVPINLKAGLDFSTALRAFLRQDPNIIMVGEIRDLDTAQIAVKASQTGHLVLSTLHTNSAPESLIRLSNMGIEPYNIASTIEAILAQRLIRKLCKHCKEPLDIPEHALKKSGFTDDDVSNIQLFGPGKGCTRCTRGYKGRLGIFEVMSISEEMGRLIMSGGNAIDLKAQAAKEGVLTLRQSGLLKVKEGITTLEEINRVTTL